MEELIPFYLLYFIFFTPKTIHNYIERTKTQSWIPETIQFYLSLEIEWFGMGMSGYSTCFWFSNGPKLDNV
jgi:hypothetical protein